MTEIEHKDSKYLETFKKDFEKNLDSAIIKSVDTLAKPDDIRNFTDLDDFEIYNLTMLKTLEKTLVFPELDIIYRKYLNRKVSKKRKGRSEMEGIGKAGVERQNQENFTNRLFGRM